MMLKTSWTLNEKKIFLTNSPIRRNDSTIASIDEFLKPDKNPIFSIDTSPYLPQDRAMNYVAKSNTTHLISKANQYYNPGSIWKSGNKPISQTPSTSSSNTSEIWINLQDPSKSLIDDLRQLSVVYPSLIKNPRKPAVFIQNVLAANVSQSLVIHNLSFQNSYGSITRKVSLYSTSSNFGSSVLDKNQYFLFTGKVSKGDFIIENVRTVENPIVKDSDFEKQLTIYYTKDDTRHPNALYDYTNTIAVESDELKGQLKDWYDYLDWKRKLSEAKIKGIKYLAAHADIENRQMNFLAVAPDKESWQDYRKILRREDLSVYSDNYSEDIFEFSLNNKEDDTSKFEQGIQLNSIDFGQEGYLSTLSNNDIEYWDSQSDSMQNYDNPYLDVALNGLIGLYRNRYMAGYYCILHFDFTDSQSEYVNRAIRSKGYLTSLDASAIVRDFYPNGFIATTQVGDLALISREKRAIETLAMGQSVSSNLDRWLFDISAARVPDTMEEITQWQNQNLNEDQKKAVEKMVFAKDVALVQGPPGTGKTTVIAEAIYQFVIRNKRVLITSQANLAVDNALERLISNPNVRAIRLGKAEKIDSSVDNITERNVLENFYNSLTKYIRTKYQRDWDESDVQVQACKDDIEFVEECQRQITNAKNKIEGLQNVISAYNDGTLNDELNNAAVSVNLHHMELPSLQVVANYVKGESDESNFNLSADSIEALYHITEPFIQEFHNLDISVSSGTIDLAKLRIPANLIKANNIIGSIFYRMRLLQRIIDKSNSTGKISSNADYEALKSKESYLRNQMLSNPTPDVMNEWREIAKKIRDFETSSRTLSDDEQMVLGTSYYKIDGTVDTERAFSNAKNCAPILDQLKVAILNCITSLNDQYLTEINEFNDKSQKLETEMSAKQETINKLNFEKASYQETLLKLAQKYNCEVPEIIPTIRSTIKNSEKANNNKINRALWEPIFTGFKNWIENIPDFDQENEEYMRSFINGCNVVGVSCTENAKTLTEKGFSSFDVVIIDEVSKATPPELLIPMNKGSKTILVGDHRQLPPLFNEHEKSYREVLESSENSGDRPFTAEEFEKYKNMVTSSLFQQYFEHANPMIKHSLLTQYRMDDDIMKLVNEFYDGLLKNGITDRSMKAHHLRIPSINNTQMIVPEKHAYWFDSSNLDGTEIYEQRKIGSTSSQNILEAKIIINLLKKMDLQYANMHMGSKIDVGIISFYHDQVVLIRNLLKSESFNTMDIEVNTVDRFQGKEKQIIFVSLVRNVKSQIRNEKGFIAAFQRINVAFSRAEDLLIIVGATDMYATQPVMLTDMNNGEQKRIFIYKNIIDSLHMSGALFNANEVIDSYDYNDIINEMKAVQ